MPLLFRIGQHVVDRRLRPTAAGAVTTAVTPATSSQAWLGACGSG